MINPFNLIEKTKHSSELINGLLLKVFKDEVILPNNTESQREWIKHPGATAVVPMFENGDIMLINQFRYPPRQLFLEVPAGKIDPNEDPLHTGIRELREETGLSAGSFEYVGHFYPCIGYSDEIIHIYLAKNLKQSNASVDDDEFVEPVRVPFDEALKMVDSGEISDGKTVISLLRTYRYLNQD